MSGIVNSTAGTRQTHKVMGVNMVFYDLRCDCGKLVGGIPTGVLVARMYCRRCKKHVFFSTIKDDGRVYILEETVEKEQVGREVRLTCENKCGRI